MKRSIARAVLISFVSTLIVFIGAHNINAQVQAPIGISLEIYIPSAPTPVRANGKTHLAYELHLTNFRSVDLALTRVEVFGGDRSATALADYQDAELTKRLARPGARPDLPDKRVIGGGMRAVLFVWLTLDDAAAVPTKLQHKVSFNLIRPTGSESGVIEGGQINVRNEAPLVINSPLRGGPWVAGFGASNDTGHRRTILAINGIARIPQRFAIDWMKLGDDGRPARDDTSKLSNWYGYGTEVLAVADSVVSDVKDGIPEPASVTAPPQVPITLETAGGNYVILDLGNGRFALYGHLQPGSIRVKVGDRVRSGQVIGLLGHSGNSTAPHLHFHICDANSPLSCEGLPYVIKGFEVLGAIESPEMLDNNGQWKPQPGAAASRHKMELPLANTVLRFP